MAGSTSSAVPATVGRARPARRRPLPLWAPGLVGILAVLVLVELLTLSGILDERYFPRVSADLATLVTELGTASFWTAVGQTLRAWAVSFGLATAAGILVGAFVGLTDWLHSATRVVIEFLRPIPSVALIPLAVLVFGTGMQSAVFLATFASLWPILIHSVYGVRDVDPLAIDTARSFGIPRTARLLKVILPSSIPYIVTGLRIGSTTALILVITAQLVIGTPGLGQEINVARSGGNLELMYALTIATGLLGWLLNGFFVALERRVLHWHPSQRLAEGPA
jgi:ABC-type nitrate/sulfonate/bicarbonate transport system permease component